MKKIKKTDLLATLRIPATVFILHSLLDFGFGIYEYISWFDIPMHFIGGISIALMLAELYTICTQAKIFPKLMPGVYVLVGTSMVVTVAVLWEFWEFLVDHSFATRFQPGIADTMLDLFLGLTGGFIMLCILSRKSNVSKKRKR